MAERPSGKKLTANELVLQKLKETFERNENVAADSNWTNVWVMLVAIASFSESSALPTWPLPHSEQRPSHHVRVVLRTSTSEGDNP